MTDAADKMLDDLILATPEGWIAAHRDTLPRDPERFTTAALVTTMPPQVRESSTAKGLSYAVGRALRALGAVRKQARDPDSGVPLYFWTLPDDFR